MVWCKKNTELNKENLCPMVKHGEGSVLVWGCMSVWGVEKLHINEGIMDHKAYINILKTNLKASAEMMNLKDKLIFMQDNNLKHLAWNIKMWLLYNKPQCLYTPPQSPDVNPMSICGKF
ncbi:hypothetical protein ILUMI_20847 [Ignelater luminosus]|uniref:Transposase n=1 Tax=Ignelater luminosus TaxID=2038154 RepID=A0A8K0FYI7_IGNLU|nr:hypothetical protein ILUMI_20847 [Ignelater luminosus]